ncbi:MAG: hypothetical protein IKR43_03775, partial [Lachnospiraceae bacterium]|nr:hypothetical protein [Lachnospiraceae bacterium]
TDADTGASFESIEVDPNNNSGTISIYTFRPASGKKYYLALFYTAGTGALSQTNSNTVTIP